MGNLRVYREEGNSVGHVQRLTLRIPIGATGAPGTAVQSWGFGINGGVPLTRTGVGTYTVNLSDWFPASSLMGYGADTIQGTIAAGDGVTGIITTEAYSTAGTNPTVTLVMIASNTGVAAEVRNGATLLLELVFKNTSQAF
jgi:hypothetical protein